MPGGMNGNDNQAGGQDLAAQSMSILGSLHAAMVNFHLYPPTSEIVQESVARALDDLKGALSAWGGITFCELEGKLLINENPLDERDQSRPNTVAFLKDLALWEARSITFEQGLEEEELRRFLEVFSSKRADRTLEGSLSSMLDERGIEHIKVDEKIYVSLSKDQELAPATPGSRGGDAVDLLRDEVFVRFLVGKAPDVEVPPEEVSRLMSDPERINAAFASVMMGFESSGGNVGPDKARLIRDTVDRMYGLVETLSDEGLKQTLSEEIVNILAALEAETLVEVLSESTPQLVKDPDLRKEIVSSIEGDNVLKLTDQVVEKYRRLLAERESMEPADYEDISSVLNAIISDLYTEADPSYHPEITRRLRESGLIAELTRSHPVAGKEMRVYTVVSDIRNSGSLRALEGLSDEEVIGVAAKLLDLGEGDLTRKIIDVISRNLESERSDFRVRACGFLQQLHLHLRERGHRAEIPARAEKIQELAVRESDPEVKVRLIELLGYIANDLFTEGRLEDFARAIDLIDAMAGDEGVDDRSRAAAGRALSALNPWDVGRPLVDSLFGQDEAQAVLAARVLRHMEKSLITKELTERIKGEEEISLTPQLAEVCRSMGEEMYGELAELLESNVREEVYQRILRLLELMGGNASLALARSVLGNPIPSVKAHALRAMAKISPGDPSLLPHFLQCLEDAEPEVRREAVRGLGTVDDPRSVEVLLSIVQGKPPGGAEEHPRVEEAACLALARLGPEKAVAPLSDLLRKKTFALRRRSVHPRVKAAACYALGQIGGAEVADLLRTHLEDSDPIVRNEARKALAEMRRRGYVD
ncbi:MAG: HEAT repeat domain-containing protein [Actinobacteria bacterium]|nr:HEAT repeat domain-containing protein [Actinomycetota bacterium]